MIKKLTTIALVFLFWGCAVPENQVKENIEGEEILIGPVNWDGLTQAPFAEWFVPNYKDYKVDAESLALIQPVINDIEILVFLGSWCEDSQVQVPQFYKMMDHLEYEISMIETIALERLENRDLVGPKGEEQGYNISHVPTFIFSKEGKELGRIVEYPNRTIEKDMVDILSAQ